MDTGTIQVLVTMMVYMAIVICIGLYFARRANKNSEEYFIGGRGLGPWVAAMSAEASDMSGWLLMGLPGVAYWCGLADAAWTAIGLAVGTYLNWLLVSKRLRRYSSLAGNSITVPDFFSNRFKETNKKPIMLIASIMILVFFAVYAGSCFVTCGKLFSTLFGTNYQTMMLIGVIFVVAYTFLGGFLAESASDFMQGIVMIFALVLVLGAGTAAAGGVDAVVSNVGQIPGFTDFFGIATPVTNADGVQQAVGGVPQFGAAGAYGLLTILSTVSWGLGYFGMPQVLLRFMAIRKVDELTRSRRIAVVWVVISLAAAVLIGIIGRAMHPAALVTAGGAESIFIIMAQTLFHPVVAGIVMAGILAATISSSDSYLLIAASAVSKNIFQGVVKKDATDKQVMLVSRITLVVVALVGAIVALDENSVIFTIVSFAWAGFGATFGPMMLFSLFWKRMTHVGAICGMLSGAGMVFFWKLVLRPMGGVLGIYELLPAFLLSCIVIVTVSLATRPPSEEIQKEFDAVNSVTQ